MYGYGYRPNPGPRLAMGLGITIGALSGLDTVLRVAKVSLATRAPLALIVLALYPLSFFVVGLLASRATGEVKSGTRAGLFTGLYANLTAGTITVVIVTIAPDVYVRTAYAANVWSILSPRVVMIGAIAGLACGTPLWMGAGFVVGAFGGLIGTYLYREPAISSQGAAGYRVQEPIHPPYGAPPGYPMYGAPHEQTGYQPQSYNTGSATYEPPRYVPGGGSYPAPPDNPGGDG